MRQTPPRKPWPGSSATGSGPHVLVAAVRAAESDCAVITDLQDAVMHDGGVRTERGGEQ